MNSQSYDVAIVGGGPAGATCGAFLRQYRPRLKVVVVEREIFPRDHVGESQLPVIGPILHEMGVWEKVESAGFPVKIGATYRWGCSDDLWDFHFLPNGEFQDEPRPARFEGQRKQTAFQVDRAKYDKILLDHARERGCDVIEGVAVREVLTEGERVTGLRLESGSLIEARYYVDASGHAGLIRRAFGVETEEPSQLRNVAFWDYWQNAEWAVSVGVGGTRVQVMSVGYGWLWFIPLSPTRTSVGLVCPADFFKRSGLTPKQLYEKAISDEPRIRALTANATSEGQFTTTKDWSFVSRRLTGENWMLVGEAIGFADPILAAGLSLTHVSAREAAFTLIELDRGTPKEWLLAEYESRNRRRVLQHIRFADYWYSANSHFDELKEFTREIARDAGLELDAEKAFQWLAGGGFIDEDIGTAGVGLYNLAAVHEMTDRLSGARPNNVLDGYNGFVLNVEGARKGQTPFYEKGRVHQFPAYSRDGKILPLVGLVGWVVKGLEHSPRITAALAYVRNSFQAMNVQYTPELEAEALHCLEALVIEGWVERKRYKADEALSVGDRSANPFVQTNRDHDLPPSQRSKSCLKSPSQGS
jgi:flavin-dependent dehydrogenase